MLYQQSERIFGVPEKYEAPVSEVLDIGEDVILTSGEEPEEECTTAPAEPEITAV